MREKIKLKEKYPELFTAETNTVTFFTTPKMPYISVEGEGAMPENESFAQALPIVKGLAFSIKFGLKQEPPTGFFDYYIPPFECIWTDMDKPKSQRQWKLMLLQPKFVTKEKVEEYYTLAKKKQEQEEHYLPRLRYTQFHEGEAAQILYVGSLTRKKRTLNKLHKAIEKKGYTVAGDLHEIYLTNPNKRTTDEMQSIFRFPIQKKK